MRDEKEYSLEEWKVAMENARHFNDLLIRFRMLGLPMVITLAVAGIAAASLVEDIVVWKWGIPILSAVFAMFGIIAITWHTSGKIIFRMKEKLNKGNHEKSQSPPLLFNLFELACWIIFTFILSWYSGSHLLILAENSESLSFSNVSSISLSPLALIAAVVLLVALYSMDRFYYYELLLGAVSRLSKIESSLNYSITDTTSRFIPRERATNLITFFYVLPGITLLVAFYLSCK